MTDGNLFDAGSEAADATDVLAFGPPEADQRAPRRRGRVVAVTGIAVAAAIAIVAVVLTVGSSRPPTPASTVAAASRAAAALNSESATLTEQLGRFGTIHGTFATQRHPFLDAMTLTEDLGGQHATASLILTKNDGYMQLGDGAKMPGVPAGKWIKFPVTGGSPTQSMLHMLSSEDPMLQLRMLTSSAHLRSAGPATVGGVATTKYTGTVTPATATKYLPASMANVGKLIGGDIRFTVWIDGASQIRKLTESESIESVTTHVTMTFSRFNQPLTVAVPPANQVVSAPAGFFAN